MKDLENLKRKFELEFKFAKIENQMEERFGCVFLVYKRLWHDGARIVAKTDDAHIAGELLKAFPADEEQPLNASVGNPKGTVSGMYKARAERHFNDAYTKLKITWLHKGDEFEFELKIDGSELLEQFFVNAQRQMSSIERDTYKPVRRGRIVRDMDLPIKRFLCNQIAYEGGYQSATEPERIMDIVNAIKEA